MGSSLQVTNLHARSHRFYYYYKCWNQWLQHPPTPLQPLFSSQMWLLWNTARVLYKTQLMHPWLWEYLICCILQQNKVKFPQKRFWICVHFSPFVLSADFLDKQTVPVLQSLEFYLMYRAWYINAFRSCHWVQVLQRAQSVNKRCLLFSWDFRKEQLDCRNSSQCTLSSELTEHLLFSF